MRLIGSHVYDKAGGWCRGLGLVSGPLGSGAMERLETMASVLLLRRDVWERETYGDFTDTNRTIPSL